MKLDDYLREHGLTSAEFAKLSGIMGKQSVHHYRHGLRFPTPANLRRIHDATKGAVTANDFLDQHIPPKAARRGGAAKSLLPEAAAE
jgi:transcriptional regulator with XRE-family HTH domain